MPEVDDETPEEKELVERTRALIEPFLQRNPSASLELNQSRVENPFCVIWTPWNDPSLSIFAPELDGSQEALTEALNNVILPERLNAIYHVDRRSLEAPLDSTEANG